ncbi:MAG: hypothetical protein BMS9Abin07_1106 [Acidimicrobiia bacterium]|nr:MAG: hypothetical protein BMS9Abin07_1106 [Acidimicrobiia bacterium]
MRLNAKLATDDSSLGRLFTAIGIGGLIAAAVGAVLGVILVWSLAGSMDRSLTVTATAIAAADDTVTLAAQTVAIVSDSFDTLVPAATLAAGSFEDAASVIADTSTVVTIDVPNALEAVLDAMPAVESVAGIIDTTLGALSFFGVDYDPDVPFDEAVAEIAAGIEPLPELLRAQAEPLEQLASDFDEFGAASAVIAVDLEALQTQLDTASRLLSEYAATTTDASLVVADVQADLGWQRWLMIVLVVLAAFVLAALQVVPLALGARLKAGAPAVP